MSEVVDSFLLGLLLVRAVIDHLVIRGHKRRIEELEYQVENPPCGLMP